MFYESLHNSGEEAMEFREKRDAATAFRKQSGSEIFILESPAILTVVEMVISPQGNWGKTSMSGSLVYTDDLYWVLAACVQKGRLQSIWKPSYSDDSPPCFSIFLTIKSTPVQRSNRKYPS